MPKFVWITPNLCHDMHDCGVAEGDAFLSKILPPLLSALGPTGVMFVTWDEASGSSALGCCEKAAGGRIATIVASPLVPPGLRSAVSYDLYSILRTIEDAWGLLLHAADDRFLPSFLDPGVADPSRWRVGLRWRPAAEADHQRGRSRAFETG